MPRRRRTPKARTGGLTRAQARWFLDPATARRDPVTLFAGGEAEARAIWKARRATWLPEYQATYHDHRPPAFWRFDAPEDLRDDAVEALARAYVPGTLAHVEQIGHAARIWAHSELARRRAAWLQAPAAGALEDR